MQIVLPAIAGLVLGLWLFVQASRQSDALRPWFMAFAACVMVWCTADLGVFGYAGTPRADEYVILGYLGKTLIGPVWLVITLRFLEQHGMVLRWRRAGIDAALLAFGAALFVLPATNGWHHAFFALAPSGGFIPGRWYWIVLVGVYACVFASAAIFVYARMRSRSTLLHRRINYFLAGMAMPASLHLLWVFGWWPGQNTPGPLGFGLACVFLQIGAYRVELFGFVPVALREALAHSQEGYIVVDPSGTVLYVNEAGRRALLPAQVRPGGDAVALCAEVFAQSPRGQNAQAVIERGLRGELTEPYVATVRTAGDPERWLHVSVAPMREHGSACLGLLFTLHDVTAERELQEKLTQSEHQFRAAVEHGPLGVLLTRQDSRIVYANQQLAEMLGYRLEDVIGKDFRAFLPPEGIEIVTARRAAAARGETTPNQFYVTARRADGTLRQLEVFETSLTLDGELLDQVNVLDVTEIEASRRQQEQLRARLAQAEKLGALGEMVSGVAHELNNPLTAVAGYAELLQLDGDLPGGSRDMAGKILDAVERCQRIVNNLLDFARHRPPASEAVDLNAIIKSAVELRSYDFTVNNCGVELRLAPELPPCLGDRTQLEQVVLNLLNNAYDAVRTMGGGGRVTVATRVGAAGPVLSVEDTGPGIPAEDRDRIFDPFFSTKGAQGTGLGLSVSFGIVEAHGGHITLDTVAPASARFTVTLPAASDAAASDAAVDPPAEPAAASRTTPHANRRALVVDDEPNICDLSRRILESVGFDVVTAGSGDEARALLERADFDLIVSDLRMPGELDGQGLYHWLTAHRPELVARMLFTTGDTLSPGTGEFLATVGAPCLPKPFRRAAYLDAVNDLLTAAGQPVSF